MIEKVCFERKKCSKGLKKLRNIEETIRISTDWQAQNQLQLVSSRIKSLQKLCTEAETFSKLEVRKRWTFEIPAFFVHNPVSVPLKCRSKEISLSIFWTWLFLIVKRLETLNDSLFTIVLWKIVPLNLSNKSKCFSKYKNIIIFGYSF